MRCTSSLPRVQASCPPKLRKATFFSTNSRAPLRCYRFRPPPRSAPKPNMRRDLSSSRTALFRSFFSLFDGPCGAIRVGGVGCCSWARASSRRSCSRAAADAASASGSTPVLDATFCIAWRKARSAISAASVAAKARLFRLKGSPDLRFARRSSSPDPPRERQTGAAACSLPSGEGRSRDRTTRPRGRASVARASKRRSRRRR